jgi:hypothetical protein
MVYLCKPKLFHSGIYSYLVYFFIVDIKKYTVVKMAVRITEVALVCFKLSQTRSALLTEINVRASGSSTIELVSATSRKFDNVFSLSGSKPHSCVCSIAYYKLVPFLAKEHTSPQYRWRPAVDIGV